MLKYNFSDQGLRSKFLETFGITALAAVIGFSMTSCATTTIGGTNNYHGLLSGIYFLTYSPKNTQKIGQYYVFLGIIDVSSIDYSNKVMEAVKSGKTIYAVSRNFFGIIVVTTAYEVVTTAYEDVTTIYEDEDE
jgi:hypothetical protein